MSSADPAYHEHAPHPALYQHVACYWTRWVPPGGSAALRPHRVLPDGCVDILFDLLAPDARLGEVVGTMTRPIVVAPDARGARFVGVRFKPGGAFPFLRVPMDTLVDEQVALGDLWRDSNDVAERVAAARGPVAAVRVLEQVLLARAPAVPAPDPLLAAVVGRMARDPAATSVRELAAQSGMTRQHLTRQFRAHVGVGPKMLARVLRLRRAAQALGGRGGQKASLATLATFLGYCDQAHMTNEVRALAGVTPLELQRGG